MDSSLLGKVQSMKGVSMDRATVFAMTLLALSASAQIGLAQGLEAMATFDPALGELPESVTIDKHGNLYFSMSNSVRKRTPQGALSTFGTLPIQAFALGVKVGLDGCVYTASTSLDPTIPGAFVWRICAAGQVEQFAELDPTGGPNDLAFDDSGNLYVTDPVLGQIWKVTPDGEPTVWLAHPLLAGNPDNPVLIFRPLGVNGIAFDKHKHNLYVSNLDFGQIVRIAVQHNGSAGAVSIFVSDPRISGADGIAFDKQGNLFVAVNAQDSLVSIAPNGAITVRAQGGLLDAPSSVVFGTKGHDKNTLYITSSAFSRALGLKPGTPHPALLRMSVEHKGLRLP
jgi:sugar lactone lactonase YvrE